MRKVITTFLITIFLSITYIFYINRSIYTYYVLERKIRSSDVNYVENFLNKGGDPNHVFRKQLKSARSLLAIGTVRSDIPMVEMLLAKGADPNHFYSKQYSSPFIDAIYISPRNEKSYAIVSLFTEKFSLLKQNCDGDTPVHCAYRVGDSRIIKILGQHPEYILALEKKNRSGETPLDVQQFSFRIQDKK